MASIEDYDEFGNYIGADLDSDDEDEVPQNTFVPQPAQFAAPLEGYDEPNPGAMMEIDGTPLPWCSCVVLR